MIDDLDPGTGEVSTAITTGAAELTLLMIVDLTPAAVEDFQHYEDIVLQLLPRHGGLLERRLRSADQCFESHLITFDRAAGYDAFISDPERAVARAALPDTGIDQRVLIVHDAFTGTNPALDTSEPPS